LYAVSCAHCNAMQKDRWRYAQPDLRSCTCFLLTGLQSHSKGKGVYLWRTSCRAGLLGPSCWAGESTWLNGVGVCVFMCVWGGEGSVCVGVGVGVGVGVCGGV
jgi:hypothetical protein